MRKNLPRNAGIDKTRGASRDLEKRKKGKKGKRKKEKKASLTGPGGAAYTGAMFGKKKHENTLPEDIVSLKPLFGIRPGVYLTALYGAVCAGILFFALVYPGLANPGAVLSLRSEPSGAAVRIDGVYR